MEIKNALTTLSEIPADRKYVPDWRDNLPDGSLWTPGSKGQPGCTICRGTGWMRLNVPTSHPKFGKLQFCECVNDVYHAKLDLENSPSYKQTPR